MICWIPLYTMNTINAFCKECLVNEWLIYFGIILSHLNSAINPLLYAYHLKDFRGALYRLLTCKSTEVDNFYRPSMVSQQQQRVASQLNQRRAYQQRLYIDSPVWQRQQILPLEPINENRKRNDVDPGFGKWERDPAPSDTHQSPALRRNHSSQSNKIFIVSDDVEINNCEPQGSSLYRIVNRQQQEVNGIE